MNYDPVVNKINMMFFDEAVRKIEDATKEISGKRVFIQNILKDNARLQTEAYKDEALQQMKDRLNEMENKMQKWLARSFVISEDEWEQIKEWQLKHEIEDHGLDTEEKRMAAMGCCGGRYEYIFVPTSIGVIGTVKCTCGAEYMFQKLS